MRIGMLLERADGTARMLRIGWPASHRQRRRPVADYCRGACCCARCRPSRSTASCFARPCHAERVAELLVLRADVPRSLRRSGRTVCDNLPRWPTPVARNRRRAGELDAMLRFGRSNARRRTARAFLDDCVDRVRDMTTASAATSWIAVTAVTQGHMQLHIRHEPVRLREPASYSIQTLKLTPRRERAQRTLCWRIRRPAAPRTGGCRTATHAPADAGGAASEMRIVVEGVVDIGRTMRATAPAPLDGTFAAGLPRADAPDARQRGLRELASGIRAPSGATRATLLDLVDAASARPSPTRRASPTSAIGHRCIANAARASARTRRMWRRRLPRRRHPGALCQWLYLHGRRPAGRQPCLGRRVARRRRAAGSAAM